MVPSARTQQKLADLASGGGVVRTICELFEGVGFRVPAEAEDPPDSGIRRWYVWQYLSSADWENRRTQAAFGRIAAAAVEDWGHDWSTGALTPDALALIRAARRDGIPLSESGELSAPAASTLPLDRFSPLTETTAVHDGLARIERTSNRTRTSPSAHARSLSRPSASTCLTTTASATSVAKG